MARENNREPTHGAGLAHSSRDRAHQLETGLDCGLPFHRSGLNHLRIDFVSTGGETFGEARCAQVLRAGAHARIALAGVVRDKKKPYFHGPDKIVSVAPLAGEVNAK